MAMANAGVVLRQAAEQLVQGSLSDLVTRIRRNKGKDEVAFVNTAIQAIRKELKSTNRGVKAVAVLKLAYLQMMGFEMSAIAPDVVEVMSYTRFAHKRIGYLAAAQTFNSATDMLIMSTNLFRKDVTSSNQYEAGIALSALSAVVTPDLARDLAPDIVTLLSHSRPYVRKKAILVLYNIFVALPDSLRPAFPKLREKLKDEDLSIVSAVVSVLCELARKNPSNYVKLAPALFHLLTSGSAHAWLQLKLVRLFALLCPVEPRLPKRLVEPLTNIINTTPVMSLLYECINTCTTGLVKHLPIMRLCIQKLRTFIDSPDQNYKYLGLLALGNIMLVHPKAVREHKDTVMRCLDDEDQSIRLRALDLLTGMVDKKNLADVVERLLVHLVDKAEGHYKTQVVGKIIAIAAQRDYKYVTDFEWYLGVLVRLTHVPGNEQGALISDQLLDVAVRVDVVRAFAVNEMVLLLKDPRFYASQSKIVEVLGAAAWITGEFSDANAAESIVGALLNPAASSLPGHIQALFVNNALKVFARLCGQTGAEASDLLSGLGSEPAPPADPHLVAALERTLTLLDERLTAFAESEVVEVQERAVFAQQVLRLYRAFGNATMAMEMARLFAQPLDPVHPDAQSLVPVPPGLDLTAQINEWPAEVEPVESWEEEDDSQERALADFGGGYQHPSSLLAGAAVAAAPRGPSASAGPVDKRYYLSGSAPAPAPAPAAAVPEVTPLELPDSAKIVYNERKQKQGSKHRNARVATALAMPAGAAAPAPSGSGPNSRRNTASKGDALSSVNLDEELTKEEKGLLSHKTYPGATAPSAVAVASPPAVVPKAGAPGTPDEDSTSGSRKKGGSRRPKKGGSGIGDSGRSSSPKPPVGPSDPAAPQVMYTSDAVSVICRVLVDPANAKQVTVQIAVQNRSASPWVQAKLELAPNEAGVALVHQSQPNPFAVAARAMTPVQYVLAVPNAVVAPTQVLMSLAYDGVAAPCACVCTLLPSLFVVAEKIALAEMGQRIAKLGAQLRTASGTLHCLDQKAGLKRVAERLRVKKIRIENGAALFYGRTVHDGRDVFVHVKRSSETSMAVEIKALSEPLAKSLVAQAIAP